MTLINLRYNITYDQMNKACIIVTNKEFVHIWNVYYLDT